MKSMFDRKEYFDKYLPVDQLEVRQASAEDVYRFVENMCDEDIEECEVAFKTPRHLLAEDNIQCATNGIYIASIKGDDVVLIGFQDIDERTGQCHIFTQTSKAFEKHKLAYVRWAEFVIVNLAYTLGARILWTTCWKEHRVCKTIERIFGAVAVKEDKTSGLVSYVLTKLNEDLDLMYEE
jgi:hypothetical protein